MRAVFHYNNCMKNENIKAYFIDLDGTLVDNKGWVSAKNVQAVRNTIKNKQHVVISTGRIGKSVQDIMLYTGIKYAVTGNGSVIVDNTGKVLNELPLSVKQVLQTLQIIKKHKLLVRLDGNYDLYGCTKWWHKTITKKFNMIPVNNYNFEQRKKHFKMVLLGVTKKNILKIMGELKKAIKGVSIVSSGGGWIIEVTNENATKGNGNQFVANIIGVKNKNEMIHIGDTMNDSTTTTSCRLVAMKNATTDLKNVADFIGPSYKKGGVAKVLNGNYIKNENRTK